MGRFSVVAMLPQDESDPTRADFVSREFDTWPEFSEAMQQVDEKVPNWRLVTICHVEDLPLLMEPPKEKGK